MQEERRKSEISVIIPMYNCEKFVPELLNTFVNQSFKDFELICVIDGATDRTEEIVAAFCNTDKRFQYVVQENLGAGEARNTGLEIAKGKYVIWVDADDMYSDKLLRELYLAAEKSDADIAMCLAEMIDFRLGTKKDKHGFDTGVFPNGAVIKPEDFGLVRGKKEDIIGGTPEENAEITRSVLNGAKGTQRNAVLMNAGAAFYVTGKVPDIRSGVEMAAELIDSGSASKTMNRYIEMSQKLSESEQPAA